MTRAEAMLMLAARPKNPPLVAALEVYLRITARTETRFIDKSQPREMEDVGTN